MTLVVRPRLASDAPRLLAVLAPVHEQDGYPLHPVHLTPDWLYDGIDDAWVAEVAGQVVGHVAVVRADDGHHLTRFFVAVDARGTGAGSVLLDTVDAWADARGLDLVLDVVEHNREAAALYERRGWQHAGTVSATWVTQTGPWLDAHVYRRPAARQEPKAT